MIGRIQNIMALGKDIVLTITTSECEFQGGEVVEVKKQTKKRSLSANAYFHVLSDKIADAMGVSKAYAKNFLLGRYGQREYAENGNYITIKVREDAKVDLMEREDIHTFLIGFERETVSNQDLPEYDPYLPEEYIDYDVYVIIRGSHTYDTREMSVLINGAISEAKILGIETLTPQELERMEGYAKHYTK